MLKCQNDQDIIAPREVAQEDAIIFAGDFNSLPIMEPYLVARFANISVIICTISIEQSGWTVRRPTKRSAEQGHCCTWRGNWASRGLPGQRVPTGKHTWRGKQSIGVYDKLIILSMIGKMPTY